MRRLTSWKCCVRGWGREWREGERGLGGVSGVWGDELSSRVRPWAFAVVSCSKTRMWVRRRGKGVKHPRPCSVQLCFVISFSKTHWLAHLLFHLTSAVVALEAARLLRLDSEKLWNSAGYRSQCYTEEVSWYRMRTSNKPPETTHPSLEAPISHIISEQQLQNLLYLHTALVCACHLLTLGYVFPLTLFFPV